MNTINEITFSQTLLRVASQGAVETDWGQLQGTENGSHLEF